MDGSTFDNLARLTATGAARRSVLRAGVALVLAGIGATALLAVEEAGAASCKKKCNKKKGKKRRGKCKKKCDDNTTGQCQAEGAPCGNDNECCGEQNLICDIPSGAGNSDGTGSRDRKCCRGVGATCFSGGPQCCFGDVRKFSCTIGTNTCIPSE